MNKFGKRSELDVLQKKINVVKKFDDDKLNIYLKEN